MGFSSEKMIPIIDPQFTNHYSRTIKLMSKLQFLENSFLQYIKLACISGSSEYCASTFLCYLRYSYILCLYLFIINLPFLVNKVLYNNRQCVSTLHS